MMDENKKVKLSDDQLAQVNGGAINTFYDAPVKPESWKYTCCACGSVGIVLGRPSACCSCNDTNIVCEAYKP